MSKEANPVALIDMDGVMFDFDGAVRERFRAAYPNVQPIARKIPAFYTAENYPPECHDAVWAISNEQDFEATLEPVAGAVEGLQRVIEAGLTPQVCSSLRPPNFAPKCRENKIAALEQHFAPILGSWIIDTAIFTPDKYLVPGAVLIDDGVPPLKNAARARWEHIVFDRDCNRTPGSEQLIRLHGWDDPELIQKLGLGLQRHQLRDASGDHPNNAAK